MRNFTDPIWVHYSEILRMVCVNHAQVYGDIEPMDLVDNREVD